MKKALTTGEVAKYCGVNFRTVIRWIERGQLKAFKLPGRGDNRISIEHFVAFLREHDMPVPSEFQELSRRVLIIEDQPQMAAAIERVLRRAGLETRIVSDSFQAGTQLAEFNPSMITLDLQMPGLNGFHVLDFLRQDDRYRGVKVLVISALSEKQLQSSLEQGADEVLSKPFDNQQLLDKVASLLDLNIVIEREAPGAAEA
ncbi:response regulator [Pokkaliibacter sp. CJK22405]|uniref:response regulator n=1 Tax=Pokkaliibacter sp. CJK22405 TaxID=3384615 RepID=UPI00398464A5